MRKANAGRQSAGDQPIGEDRGRIVATGSVPHGDAGAGESERGEHGADVAREMAGFERSADDDAEAGEAERNRSGLTQAQPLAEEGIAEEGGEQRRAGGKEERIGDGRRLHGEDERDRGQTKRERDNHPGRAGHDETRQERPGASGSQDNGEGAGDAEVTPDQELPRIEIRREPQENRR